MRYFIMGLMLTAVCAVYGLDLAEFNRLGVGQNWQSDYQSKYPGKWSLDSGDKPLLRMECGNGGQVVRILTEANLEPGQPYTLSVMVKGENLEAADKTGMRVLVRDSAGRGLNSISPAGRWKFQSGTFDWYKCEMKFTVPPDGVVRVVPELRGLTGTVWLVEMQLAPVEKQAPPQSGFPLKYELIPVSFQEDRYWLLENLPGILLLEVTADWKPLAGVPCGVTVELPEFVRLVGSNGITTSTNGEYPPNPMTEIKPGVFKITFIEEFKRSFPRARPSAQIYLQAAPGSAGKQGTVSYRMYCGDKQAPASSFTVNVLDPLPADRPKTEKFKTMISIPSSQYTSFREVSGAYANFWNSLAPKPWAFLPGNALKPELRKEITAPFESLIFMGGSASMPTVYNVKFTDKKFAGKIPMLVYADGTTNSPKKKGDTPSVPYILDDPEGLIWEKIVPDEIRERLEAYPETKGVVWDYEPGAKHGFCLENRKRFASCNKLPTVPEIKDIFRDYSGEWFKFRIMQHNQTVEKFAAMMRKHFPNLKFYFCTDSLKPNGQIAEWCAVDPRLAEPVVDMFMNMPYLAGTRYFDEVEYNVKKLKKPNFPLINPSQAMLSYYRIYDPGKVFQNVIATAALGNEGIGFWRNDYFDGRYLRSISDAYAAVAQVENFYCGGKRLDTLSSRVENMYRQKIQKGDQTQELVFPPLDKDIRTLLHTADGEYLITAFNYNSNRRVILNMAIADIPDGEYRVYDLVSRREYTGLNGAALKKGFLAEIQPESVAVLEITAAAAKAELRISQPELARELERELAEYRSMNLFQTMAEGEARIYWDLLTGYPEPVPVLQTAAMTVALDVASGDIVSVAKAGSPDLLAYGKYHGQLGVFMINHDNSREKVTEFKMKKMDITAGIPRAEFSATVGPFPGANPEPNPLEGLEINKTVTVDPKLPRLTVNYELTNRSPRSETMNFSFSIRNYGYPGTSFSGLKSPVEFSDITLNGAPVERRGNMVILKDGAKIPFEGRLLGESVKWNGETAAITAANGSFKEELSFGLPDSTAGIYNWRSLSLLTLEPFTAPITLAPGQSFKYEMTVSIK